MITIRRKANENCCCNSVFYSQALKFLGESTEDASPGDTLESAHLDVIGLLMEAANAGLAPTASGKKKVGPAGEIGWGENVNENLIMSTLL